MTERSALDAMGHQNGIFYRVTPLTLRQAAQGSCAPALNGHQTILVELQKIKPSHPVPGGVTDFDVYRANGIWVGVLIAAGVDGVHGKQAMPGSVPRPTPTQPRCSTGPERWRGHCRRQKVLSDWEA